jgi:hypothetical protein
VHVYCQGVPPAALSSIQSPELAGFIKECLAPRQQRPKSRHLLKHPYFESIRQEKAALKLGCEALSGPSSGDALECPLLSSASRQSSGMPDWVNDPHTQLLAVPEEQELLSGDDRSVPHCSPPPSMPVSEAGDMLNGSAEDPNAFLMRGSDAGSDNGSTSGGVIVTGNYTYSVKGTIDPDDNTKLQLRLRIRPEEGMPFLIQLWR